MILANIPFDPNAWYCDCNGMVHYLREHSPQDVFLEDRGSYIEIHLLAAPDGGDKGRAVLDSYVFHTPDESLDEILKAAP